MVSLSDESIPFADHQFSGKVVPPALTDDSTEKVTTDINKTRLHSNHKAKYDYWL